MALSSLRLRRTLTGLLTLHRSLSATSSTIPFPHSTSSPLPHGPTFAQSPASPQHSWTLLQSRTFRLSSLSSSRSAPYGNNEEIGPDTILFEGCDYNHWLIVMDFPKDDNKPSPEEMVRTYEETCARGLNISVEEAKQKMYACSTTTYTGFQVVMSEEESNKFEGLPGVIFVLPDSYIDPKNKEYGGDKYMNGTIIPRPPPVQYGRQGGRYNDRNRNPNQGRYDRQGPMSNQQGPMSNQQGPMSSQHGNPPYGQQWQPTQGGGNNEASQNYSPPIQGENKGLIVNTPGGRDAYQPGRDPSYQGNYNRGEQRGYYPREQRNIPQGDQRNYVPPGQGGTRGRNYGPPHTETHGQGYGQGSSPGAYGQGPSPGAYEQGPSPGAYGQRPSSGGYSPGTASGNGQSYAGNGRDQRFSQGEQRNVHDEQSNYAPMGQTGIDQGRY